MKLPFGLEISKKPTREPKKRTNSLLSLLLPKWAYGREIPNETDFAAMLNAYRSWVYVCAGRNATSVAQATLRLYVAKPSKNIKLLYKSKSIRKEQLEEIESRSHIQQIPSVRKAIEFEEILEHPVLDLVQKVNSFMNYFDLWEVTQLHQELVGNAYWLLLKDSRGLPYEIWPMPPDKVKVIPDPNKFISGYAFRTTFNEVKIFPEEDVIHFKFPNPRTPYSGMSPLAAIIPAYNINEQMYVYETSVFQNMGRLEGAFLTDEALDDEDFNKLKDEIRDSYIGAKNAGKTPLLDKGLKYENFALGPAELSFDKGKENIKEEICNAYGQNLGMYDKSATRANADAATYNFMKNTIKPRCIRHEQKLNEKLAPYYDDRIFFMFDNVVPEDREQARKERESNTKYGITAINEERKKLRMPPVVGGDEPLVQKQMITLTSVMKGDNLDKPEPVKPASPSKPKPKKDLDEKILLLSELIAEDIKEKIIQEDRKSGLCNKEN